LEHVDLCSQPSCPIAREAGAVKPVETRGGCRIPGTRAPMPPNIRAPRTGTKRASRSRIHVTADGFLVDRRRRAESAVRVCAPRRWHRWGASQGELRRAMAGDIYVHHASYSATLAVTVDAPPEDIWRWLVQMGYRRGGLYSYDSLDRLFGYLDRPSAVAILPEFQRLHVGDEIPMDRDSGFPVQAITPGQSLVLAGVGDSRRVAVHARDRAGGVRDDQKNAAGDQAAGRRRASHAPLIDRGALATPVVRNDRRCRARPADRPRKPSAGA
jgi:hypothetical protein